VTLAELSLADMQSVESGITDAIFSVLTPLASATSRTSYGGTSPIRVREQVARWRTALG
jgi:argininosuccinate lyase